MTVTRVLDLVTRIKGTQLGLGRKKNFAVLIRVTVD